MMILRVTDKKASDYLAIQMAQHGQGSKQAEIIGASDRKAEYTEDRRDSVIDSIAKLCVAYDISPEELGGKITEEVLLNGKPSSPPVYLMMVKERE